MKLSKIVDILNLDIDVSKYNLDISISKINNLKDGKIGEISFLENSNYLKDLKNSSVSAVLISEENSEYLPSEIIPLISKYPYIDLAKISKYFATNIEIQESDKVSAIIGNSCEIAKSVFLGSSVIIGNNVRIMHNSYIGDNVTIGNNTTIYPNITVYKEVIIGNNVIIHSGSVIGSDGFGFATTKTGEHIKIYQNGNVIIEDSVEIGSNTSIDRAVFNSTIIRKGARIDNLVQIAHNCDIGIGSVLAAQVGIAGSTELGRNVVMGGQSGAVGHIKIAPFSTITGKAGVTKSITKSGLFWSGYPIFEHKNWLKLQSRISQYFNKKI